ncbi:gamma carbonic anhydrase family protein [Ovoidimarina sediminis]|uniref:gamma carbonic anhydrase family protein n=1 Tax=Ovoidimarina sediminis TaxID=3079856 RepID=UPI0029068A93|nr:gamma carbonic anhydrase family protein [Rhodophyticola sp. MJ-SS7]MDU8941927.1 gamma carbonic anhydrase family protein [Rhodophyticola sp. MJ-SS7]
MTTYALGGLTPAIDEDSWIAPGAHVIGNVTLAGGVGIWFSATLRGDIEPIVIGENTNIQENTVCHTDAGFPLTVGRGCTIGHKAMLHGCTIGNNTLIGMGATVLNGAKIGNNCLIGAGALVTEGKEIPDGSLVVGAPGAVRRGLSEEEIAGLTASAERYLANMRRFRADLTAL